MYGAYVSFSDFKHQVINVDYTLSQYQYGPDGNATFNEKSIDKKRELKVTTDRGNKDWNKRPTKYEYAVIESYLNFLNNNVKDNASYQEYIRAIGGKFEGKSITAQQVETIFDKVMVWTKQ